MKIQILKDSKGQVIATLERTLAATVSTEPEVSEGQELVEVEVPDEYMRMPAPEFIERLQVGLQVDIKAKREK